MHICVITEECPSKNLYIYPFIEQLFKADPFANIKVSIIAPQSLTKSLVRRIPLKKTKIKLGDSPTNPIDIYFPLAISFGSVKFLEKLNFFFFSNAINRGFKQIKSRPDILYAHFWHNGVIAYNALNKYKLPMFVASGESEIDEYNIFRYNNISKFIASVNGVICVSTKNKTESISLKLTTDEKCIVLPNGINNSLFYKKNKEFCRSKIGAQNDEFVVAFVGSFENRKGANRVADAISLLDNPRIKSIFIGKPLDGTVPYLPNCKGILHSGPLPHSDIPDYLNGADVFVLPTLAEGCCNAIIEALGCGLPIISSDLAFNYDVLDNTNSILVDPLNVKDISNAIETLLSNKKMRDSLSAGALKRAAELSINTRAEKVIDFIIDKL